MSDELIYGLLIMAGLVILAFAGILTLAHFAKTAGTGSQTGPELPAAEGRDTHRLSVEIAEALIQNRVIDPGRFSEVAQIVALRLELQKALGSH